MDEQNVYATIAFSVDPTTNLGRICAAADDPYGEFSCKIVIDDDEGHLEIPVRNPRPGKFLTDGRRRETDDDDNGLPLEDYPAEP